MFHLLPEWILPFVAWGVVATFYYSAKTIIINRFKFESYFFNRDIVWWCLVSGFFACVIAIIIFFLLISDTEEGSSRLAGKIEILNVLLPTVIPAMLGAYKAAIKHNEEIENKHSINKYGWDIHGRKKGEYVD